MKTAVHLRSKLAKIDRLAAHPNAEDLLNVVTGPTGMSSSGFPYICESCFSLFIQDIPHLFGHGLSILGWLRELEWVLDALDELTCHEIESLARAIRVVRNMVFTAGITAPPDMWILRHVLALHREMGTLGRFLDGAELRPAELAREHGWNEDQVRIDFHLLHCRGYLEHHQGRFSLSGTESAVTLFSQITPAASYDVTARTMDWLAKPGANDDLTDFYRMPYDAPFRHKGWWADLYEIELGYRIVSLILALRAADMLSELTIGADFRLPLLPEMLDCLKRAGLVRSGRVTQLGARVFQRAPGPFGIIATYQPYMQNLKGLMSGEVVRTWVNRSANVAASQDANRKTFQLANQALDDFCRDHDFSYDVFVEHAVGKGEASRQRMKRSGQKDINYFGADLENAAIDRAIEEQGKGLLPGNMRFIRNADIAQPERVIDFLREQGCDTEGGVMMVGNGFHEVRNQSNRKMVSVFKGYHDAGMILIFTEESALRDEDLLATAWNTYHAGFRYVHELSGQGLRPAEELETPGNRYSWSKCARLAGYVKLEQYSRRTRTIFPHPRPDGHNPAISETLFCIPDKLAKQLGNDPKIKAKVPPIVNPF